MAISENDLRSVFLQFAEAVAFCLTDGSEVQTAIGAIESGVLHVTGGCRVFQPREVHASQNQAGSIRQNGTAAAA